MLCARSSSDILPIERIICVSSCVATIEGAAVICIQLQTLRQPLREIRVRNEPATEDDQICIARLELGHSVITVEATSSDEIDAALFQDIAEVDETVALNLGSCFRLDTLATA